MAFFAKDFLEKMKSDKSKDVDEYMREKTKGNVTGTLIGAGIGLLIGYKRKYNIIVSVFIGALAGNLITRAFLSEKKKED